MVENDEETNNKNVKINQNIEILSFCVRDIEKITPKMIYDLSENKMLSTVGHETGNDFDSELEFPSKELAKM